MAHLLRESDAMTITIGSPDVLDGEEGRRVLAAFYGELLGMQAFEPYGWLKLAKRPPEAGYIAGDTTDGGSKLQLALDGDGWSDERPPRWPDPEYPQQMHLDIFVPDATAADTLVVGRGATLLLDQGDFRTYADPAGHPFCLYPSADTKGAKVGRLVLDCFSPRALASFYAGFLGAPERLEHYRSASSSTWTTTTCRTWPSSTHSSARPVGPTPHTRRNCMSTIASLTGSTQRGHASMSLERSTYSKGPMPILPDIPSASEQALVRERSVWDGGFGRQVHAECDWQ